MTDENEDKELKKLLTALEYILEYEPERMIKELKKRVQENDAKNN